jgi:serine/threonine-protein kinase
VTGPDPRRVEEVFDSALERSGDDRARYLDAACAGNPPLRAEVDALLERDAAAPRSSAEEPEVPATVGRFRVLRKIGQGGMGVVFEAYDGTLGRRVAIKLVRFAADGTPSARSRLLREAQAMAKLADPHVVPVYDVGEQGDEVFIAMELVDGETLSSWLSRAHRSWREILGMYVAAGRGLSAAHARGVVHRDFKPDNVLVGTDGRPRVLDFGLARIPGEAAARPADASSEHGSLTVTGALMGTPRYMSPEHFRTQNVDARSDQFCFGVALYRALFDAAPFEGTTLLLLADNVCSGAVRLPPASEVPAGVVDAVLRSLSADPAARFPSMDALLGEFERALQVDPELDPGRGRRGRRAAVAVMAVLACLTVGSIVWLEPPELSRRAVIVHGVVGIAALCTLGVVFRKTFLASVHNRRIGSVFLVSSAAFLLHRLVALHLGAPIAPTLVGDVVVVGAVSVVGGLTVERWMLVGGPIAVVYALVIAAFPLHAVPGFGLVVIAIMATATWFWGDPRMRVRRKRTDGVSGSPSGSRTTG